MRRLEAMVRTAVTFAPHWGSDWALNYVHTALVGDEDSRTWERGRRINRRAWLGSQVVTLRERIPALEKAARKTPPRTLIAERRKVAEARVALERARADLATFEAEWRRLAPGNESEGGDG